VSTGKQRFGEVLFRQLQGNLEDISCLQHPCENLKSEFYYWLPFRKPQVHHRLHISHHVKIKIF